MENEKLLLTASAISVQEQSMSKNDVFLLIRFQILDTLPNLNKQGVTKEFINDMISRRDEIIGLPLYCDVQRLLNHDYEHLGHMLDMDGVFHSTQIGSMIDFETVEDSGVTALITTARVPKRECAICECLMELYSMDALKFSFEISFNPQYTVIQDGVIYVDKAPDNSLTGVAVVSVPACVNSCALQMVAEKNAEADEGVEKMDIKEMEAALAEKDAVIAERDATIAELNAAIAAKDEKPAEEKAEEAIAESKPEDKEVAEAEAKPEQKGEAVAEEKELPWEKEEKEEEKEDATAASDEDKKEACAEVANAATAQACEMKAMQDEINSLRVQIATLEAAKAELEAIRAEMAAKELEANQAMAKAFAERQGLDSSDETVAKAIAEVDYKMIAELTMKMKPAETNQVVVASVVTDGFEITGAWDDMLAPAK